MKLSKLNELPSTRDIIDVFGGYNHNLRIREGEFYDMKNLTSSDYPVLSPRPQRGIYAPGANAETPSRVLGMLSKDALCYVVENTARTNADLYINGYKVGFGFTNAVQNKLTITPKTLLSMGSYIIVMPDMFYVNTQDYNDCGKIEYLNSEIYGTVKFSLCKIDGRDYDVKHTGDTARTLDEGKEYENLELWLDTSAKTDVLKQWSSSSKEWVSISTTYIKISFPNSTKDYTEIFSPNDGVTFSIPEDELKLSMYDSVRDFLNKPMTVWDVGSNYFVITGMLNESKSFTLEYGDTNGGLYVNIERRVPYMDFIIESGNRLWGCRYGTARNGEVVNEIYASKLGDFKNWYSFSGISTDSYTASVGTDGQFTGAINYLGYPVFFKENCMHKVYGDYPSNYHIQTTPCRGVQKGCSKSLAIVNETLFYKSRSAICAYEGALPTEVSSALGAMSYSDAAAGAIGNKYYISMKEVNEGKYHLFVYDSQRGMWHREDDTRATAFCTCDGELFFVDYGAGNKIKSINGKNTVRDKRGILDSTDTLKWEAITGLIGTDTPDKKYISRINIRLKLEVGAKLYLSIQYDSDGAWEHMFAMSGTALKTFTVPIRPKRCDHLRLKFTGQGEVKIYSITKTIEQGSDV